LQSVDFIQERFFIGLIECDFVKATVKNDASAAFSTLKRNVIGQFDQLLSFFAA
jgi:hypothetical protein